MPLHDNAPLVSYRRLTRWALTALAGFLVGYGIGRIRSSSHGEIRHAEVSTQVAMLRPTIKDAVRGLEPGRFDQASVSQPAPSYVVRLRELAELNATLGFKFYVPLTSLDQYNHDFSSLYGLSPEQERRLTSAVTGAVGEIRKLESDRATIMPGEKPDTFRIEMPRLPKEGGAIYDKLLTSVRQVLGDDRYQYFNAVTDTRGSSTLDSFGLSRITIELRTAPTASPTAASNGGYDADTGFAYRKASMDLRFFKMQWPELYQRMVREGLVVEDAP